MLDKIFGKNDSEKKEGPVLRKNDKKSDSEIGGRIKDMVAKATERSKDNGSSKDKNGNKRPLTVRSSNNLKDDDKKERKIPRPMPKPRPKKIESPRLKPPKKKKPGGLGGGFGRRIPEDDQRTLVGAAVFGLILIIIVGAGYYFLVYAPYQTTLNQAKDQKIAEVNSFYKGPLALDPRKQLLLAEIDSGITPDQVLAVDVLGPATAAWREYQTQQINGKKDPYGRVMIGYTAGGQKNIIVKATDAQKIVAESDATVLANMQIKTPDTVAVPIIVSRLQAAGGLINVGDAVDIYVNTNTTGNETNLTNATDTTYPRISGATVLAILRAKDSGTISANRTVGMGFDINGAGVSTITSQGATADVEQLLRASASRSLNEAEINSLLAAYGWRLSDFERVSNLGELDVQYLVLLEVPREDALFIIQNSQNNVLFLTVPTQQAPDWMVNELHAIYGK